MASTNPPIDTTEITVDYAAHNRALRAYHSGVRLPPDGAPFAMCVCGGHMYKWQEQCADCQDRARAARRAESEAWYSQVSRNRLRRAQ